MGANLLLSRCTSPDDLDAHPRKDHALTALSTVDQRGIIHRLIVIGIPHDAIQPLVELAAKWVICSGEEWTVKKFKSLKVDFLRLNAGLEPVSRIRKNSKGEPYGVIGRLFRWSTSPVKMNRVLQALQIYTFFTSGTLTKSQREKFERAVNCDTPVLTGPDFKTALQNAVLKHIGTRSLRFLEDLNSRLITFRGNPNKRAPVITGSSISQDSSYNRELEYLFSPKGINSIFNFSDIYSRVLEGIKYPRIEAQIEYPLWAKEYVSKPLYGGKVHFLQEPGMKLRSIASPYRIHQIALNPLGKTLYSIVKSLPWDCTFDQSRAIPVVQGALAEGKTVHSVDLSSATDYFPLEIQSIVLRTIFGSLRDIDLFEYLSRSVWESSIGPIVWRRGQPLGLYPSFATFTLTHGLLLAMLNGNEHKDKFFVVGDDVVILDNILFNSYTNMLSMLGCPWSEDKTLSANKLAEFAGKIITCGEVYPQYKWREMSDDNFLDLCRHLGPRSRSLLSRDQKKVFDVVKHCLPPIGLNFSYPGSSYHDMMVLTDEILASKDEVVVGSLVSLLPLIIKNLIDDGVASPMFKYRDERYIERLASTFDEKVRKAFHLSPFEEMVKNNISFAGNIDDLPETSRDSRLPLKETTPSRVSTLDRLKRILRL